MADPKMHKKARQLRLNQTPAERLLWSKLRSRQLAGVKFRRQALFGHFILDFYCPEALLTIEIDGGHHGEEENQKMDAARTEYLANQGIRVERFWNHEVLENIDDVKAEIYATLEERKREKQ